MGMSEKDTAQISHYQVRRRQSLFVGKIWFPVIITLALGETPKVPEGAMGISPLLACSLGVEEGPAMTSSGSGFTMESLLGTTIASLST